MFVFLTCRVYYQIKSLFELVNYVTVSADVDSNIADALSVATIHYYCNWTQDTRINSYAVASFYYTLNFKLRLKMVLGVKQISFNFDNKQIKNVLK